MKTTLILLTAFFLSFNAFAGNNNPEKKFDSDKYCAKIMDGKLTVMHEGTTLTSDVICDNGTQIKIDGTIIQKDGSIIKMKEGECYDKEGKKSISAKAKLNKN